MAIPGQANINIGAENQQAGSDTLYDAFHKIQNNFTQVFNLASPYNTFNGGVGISTEANSTTGVVTITNTGVVALAAGTGITLSGSNGNVVISASGGGNGAVGVTNVGITSSTLTVTDSPIVSSGIITIELPLIPSGPNFAAGEYTAPTFTVDEYGRITAIANTTSIGTVTSVAIQANGNGLQVSNSPITSSGIIYLENTGVTRLRGGTGIDLTSETGEITISATSQGDTGVTRIDFFSDSLTITGSPVTSTGNIVIEIPSNVTVSGNMVANTMTANLAFYSLANMYSYGEANFNNITANLINSVFFTGEFNGVIGANGANYGTFTDVVSSNITGNVIKVQYDDNYLRFENTNGNTTDFVIPNIMEDVAYYLPTNIGTDKSVLGIVAESPMQLGWKTIPYQTLTVETRGAGTLTVASIPILRVYPLRTRSAPPNDYYYLNIS
jgi:hypothetical protein